MSLSLSLNSDKAAIGNDAGWLLGFYREKGGGGETEPILEIGAADYHTEIRAALPGGLEGGTYSFVVEGLTDEHYGMIAQGKKDPPSPTVVKLYLYWRDTNASVGGYLANIAGLTDVFGSVKGKDIPDALVAVLRIVSVSRKAGTRRYETTITARERVFHALEKQRLCKAVKKESMAEALKELLQTHGGLREGTDYTFHPLKSHPQCPPPTASPGSEQREFAAGVPILDLVRTLGGSMEESTGRYGRGQLLIRDGLLHIGTRPIPLEGDDKEPKKLMLGNGLIETEALDPVITDPNFDYCENAKKPPPENEPPRARQFKLTLKGRSDLKPGGMVEFDLPPADISKTSSSLLGALGDMAGSLLPSLGEGDFKNPVKLYVASVEHVLGRTTGFSTVVTGMEIKSAKETWDCHTPSSRGSNSEPAAHANPETEAAHAVKKLTQNAVANRAPVEVGEVRQVNTKGANEPPSQTETVWRGLAPGDGLADQARRLPIQRPSPAPAEGTPYASPFAWGKCGLVLPRYPGTRVVVVHRNGHIDDPIDLGTLWESGHGPDSKPGDWWLILPMGISEEQRATITDDKTPEEHTGKVTQDLIDADGNRVIHVGELTICVAPQNKLMDAGQRPEHGKHVDGGASIIIKPDGSVVIKAKKIDFDAGDGDITLKAANVKVSVSGSMDVS